MGRKKFLGVVAASAMLWFLSGAGTALYAAEFCEICGINLATRAATKFTLLTNKDEEKKVCSLYCAAWIVKDQHVKKISTVEYTSGETLDAKSSYFVVGSSTEDPIHPKTRLAFIDKERAAQFASKNGGSVKKYKEVMDNMLTFLAGDSNKVPKIVKTKDNAKCFTCHKETAARITF